MNNPVGAINKKNKEDEKLKFPVCLVYGMDLQENHKQTIRNFCDDFGIENVPNDNFMVAPIAVIDEVKDNQPEGIVEFFQGPIQLYNFRLDVTDGDEGQTMLVVDYESPGMERVLDKIKDVYRDSLDHEPEFDIVISYDYEGDHDLNYLSYEFNRYLPVIMTSGDISGHYGERELNGILFGVTRSEDE